MGRLGILAALVAILSLSFISPAASAPCPAGAVAMNVGSTADLQNMTNLINCTGKGSFDVIWTGTLPLLQTIELSDTKNLTITGSTYSTLLTGSLGAGIDAGNTTGLFAVSGGSTLRLQNLVLKGGSAEDGGGVDVRSSSTVNVVGCSFLNNSASIGGKPNN